MKKRAWQTQPLFGLEVVREFCDAGEVSVEVFLALRPEVFVPVQRASSWLHVEPCEPISH